MRHFLLLLGISAIMALLLSVAGAAAAQVQTEPPKGTGPTGGEAPPSGAGPTDRPPKEVADVSAPDEQQGGQADIASPRGPQSGLPTGKVVNEPPSGEGADVVAPDETGPSTDNAINEQGTPTDPVKKGTIDPAKRGITDQGVEGVFVPVGGPDYIRQGVTVPGIDIIVRQKPSGKIVADQGAEGLFVPAGETKNWPSANNNYNSAKSNTATLADQGVEAEEGILVPASNLVFGTGVQEIQTQGVPGIFVPGSELGYGINEKGVQLQSISDPKSGLTFLIDEQGVVLTGKPDKNNYNSAKSNTAALADQGNAAEPAADEPEGGFFTGIGNFFKSIFSFFGGLFG